MLRSLAPGQPDNPNVVLLTPGPHNETYFEHAYLARYLGFTLVEGGDLTVRDRRVFLKTLEGLQTVDVIFAASTTPSVIRWSCAAIPFSVFPGWSKRRARGTFRLPTRLVQV